DRCQQCQPGAQPRAWERLIPCRPGHCSRFALAFFSEDSSQQALLFRRGSAPQGAFSLFVPFLGDSEFEVELSQLEMSIEIRGIKFCRPFETVEGRVYVACHCIGDAETDMTVGIFRCASYSFFQKRDGLLSFTDAQ